MRCMRTRLERGASEQPATAAGSTRPGWELKRQLVPVPHLSGRVAMRIGLSTEARIDFDNIKAIGDLMKRMGLLDDDRQIRDLRVHEWSLGKAECVVWLQEMRPEP